VKLPRFSLPVLTKAEKTALAVLILVLSGGAALRAWEHSGVILGPVKDWESLRKMVIQARLEAGGDTVFPCFDPPPASYAEEHWPQRTQVPTEESGGSKKTPPAAPLDINTASAAALQKLPGIGPSSAKAIISHRAAHGRFRTVEVLMYV
jgi:competence ComEA-like helix-hairpin-helix protein